MQSGNKDTFRKEEALVEGARRRKHEQGWAENARNDAEGAQAGGQLKPPATNPIDIPGGGRRSFPVDMLAEEDRRLAEDLPALKRDHPNLHDLPGPRAPQLPTPTEEAWHQVKARTERVWQERCAAWEVGSPATESVHERETRERLDLKQEAEPELQQESWWVGVWRTISAHLCR